MQRIFKTIDEEATGCLFETLNTDIGRRSNAATLLIPLSSKPDLLVDARSL